MEEQKTSDELLKEKMMEYYGMTENAARNMLSSKTASKILEVLASEAGFIEKLAFTKAEEEAALLEAKATNLRIAQEEVESSDREYREDKVAVAKLRSKYEADLKDLQNTKSDLLQMETADARDKIRMYERYKADTAGLEMTPQNQTAYIFGLASILSGMPIWNFQPKQRTED